MSRTVEELAAAVERSEGGRFVLHVAPEEYGEIVEQAQGVNWGPADEFAAEMRSALRLRFAEFDWLTPEGRVPDVRVVIDFHGSETKRGESDES